jgi:type II secretory pathway component PulJ
VSSGDDDFETFAARQEAHMAKREAETATLHARIATLESDLAGAKARAEKAEAEGAWLAGFVLRHKYALRVGRYEMERVERLLSPSGETKGAG